MATGLGVKDDLICGDVPTEKPTEQSNTNSKYTAYCETARFILGIQKHLDGGIRETSDPDDCNTSASMTPRTSRAKCSRKQKQLRLLLFSFLFKLFSHFAIEIHCQKLV